MSCRGALSETNLTSVHQVICQSSNSFILVILFVDDGNEAEVSERFFSELSTKLASVAKSKSPIGRARDSLSTDDARNCLFSCYRCGRRS